MMDNNEKNENEAKEEQVPSLDLMKGLHFCVLDLETTGGDHKYDKIIEIGLVRVSNLQIVDEMSFLLNPKIPIPDFVQKLTSIKSKDLASAPIIDDVLDKITDFIGDRILVAHNVAFDVPFLNSELKRLGKHELINPTLCTNLMSKYLIPEIMNSNLTYIGEIFGIPHRKAHRALEDAKVTANVLLNFIDIFIDKGIHKVNHLYYPRKRYELDTLHVERSDWEEDFEKILNKLFAYDISLTLFFKGEKGVINAVLPVQSPQGEKEIILKYLKSPLWKTLTIQMTGCFYKSLCLLNSHFSRMLEESQKNILNYLEERHLHLKSKDKEEIPPVEETFQNYFIIRKHLIPEQYVLQSLSSIGSKNELIFRYPSHQKRLLQNINYQIKKRSSKKKLKLTINPKLNSFFHLYLSKSLPSSADSDYFIFDEDTFKNKPNIFKSTLTNFVQKHPQKINYPKEHL